MPEHGNISAESDKRADRDFIGSKNDNASKIKHDGADSPTKIDDRSKSIVEPYSGNKGIMVFLYQFMESLPRFILRMKALYDPHT